MEGELHADERITKVSSWLFAKMDSECGRNVLVTTSGMDQNEATAEVEM